MIHGIKQVPTQPHSEPERVDQFFINLGDKSVGSNGISSGISDQHVLRL